MPYLQNSTYNHSAADFAIGQLYEHKDRWTRQRNSYPQHTEELKKKFLAQIKECDRKLKEIEKNLQKLLKKKSKMLCNKSH